MKSAIQEAPQQAKTLEERAHSGTLSVIALVDNLIAEAHTLRASDIHIDPGADKLVVRLRIDGMLQDKFFFEKRLHPEIITRIKIVSNLRTDEHQAAQDGRFRTQAGEAAIDVRVSITPTYYGENAVLRLLADKAEEFTLESLGFSPENSKKIMSAVKKPYGMILATGPTGSGKTTTLYTLLKQLNTKTVSIITIEDPVEYAVEGVTQIQINPRSGLTFGSGLRSILRQDPNIIMVGEIRDSETASIAVNTALTGHLILSTLHTNDSATTLPRLLDMGVDPYLVASTVNVAIGQRLVRRICDNCKEAYALTDAEKESLLGQLFLRQLADAPQFYRGKGCEACEGTGYAGRIGIHEVMVIDPEIREAILKKASAANLKEIAKKNGMTPMFADGFMKAEQGKTTIEEVLRTVSE